MIGPLVLLWLFLQQCLFCGKDCNVHKSRKNPGRWRKAFIFRQNENTQSGKDMKQFLLDVCNDRKDKWAGEVRVRIQGAVSDLHAADARYHLDCRTTFITERAVKQQQQQHQVVPHAQTRPLNKL